MEIKLKRNLAIEFRLIKGIGDNFGVTASFYKFKDCHIEPDS